MNKSPLILLLFLLSLVIASALIDSDDVDPRFEDGRGDKYLHSSHPFDYHRSSAGNFGSFMERPDPNADEMFFLEDNIIKAEAISPRISEFVAFAKEEGNDVERVSILLDEYNLLLKDARLYFELANGSTVRVPEDDVNIPEMTQEEYQDLSRRSIMQANMLLKDIFRELRPYISGNVVRIGDDSFVAEGSGMVMLSGDLDIDLSVLNGKISYMDLKKDLNVGFENGDKVHETVWGSSKNMVLYENFTGNVTFSGSGYNLAIIGDDLTLSSSGTGEVQFFGRGYYYFTDTDGPVKKQLWVPSLVENN